MRLDSKAESQLQLNASIACRTSAAGAEEARQRIGSAKQRRAQIADGRAKIFVIQDVAGRGADCQVVALVSRGVAEDPARPAASRPSAATTATRTATTAATRSTTARSTASGSSTVTPSAPRTAAAAKG